MASQMNFDAEVGQLWSLNEIWAVVMGRHEPQTYLLIRQVGDTDVWDTLCIESGVAEVVTLSSLLYEHVV